MYRMSMSTAAVWVCEYEDCQHEWLVTGPIPAKCARCRRRGWNKSGDLPASKPIKKEQAPTARKPQPAPATPAAMTSKPAPSPGATRNQDRRGYDHAHYLALPPSEQLRYLREHPRR